MKTIQAMVEDVKSREKHELIDAMMKHGKKVADGFEVRFEGEDRPVIAGYVGEDPCDIVVSRVLLMHNGYVYLDGYEKNNALYNYADIEPSEIFAGHLSYVTEAVALEKENQ